MRKMVKFAWSLISGTQRNIQYMFHNDCLDFMHIHSKDEPIHGFDLSKEFLVFLYNVLNYISFESTSVHYKQAYTE